MRSPRGQPLGGRGRQVQPPWRRMRRHPGHARPCAGRQQLARLLGRRRPHSDRSPRVRRHRRRSGGGSHLRRKVRRGRRPAFGRLNRGDGCHLELRPRTGRALAPRNLPPTQRRCVAQLRSAFAESPHHHALRDLEPGRTMPCRPTSFVVNAGGSVRRSVAQRCAGVTRRRRTTRAPSGRIRAPVSRFQSRARSNRAM